MDKYKISVVTATYNRAHTLERLYESLCNQTCKHFVWIVVDDGSTDSTNELIQKFISQNKIEIKYLYKKNGGKHTALNYSYQYIDTEFVINIDSDDEMTPDAIELIISNWKNIPEKDRDRFWCVSGRCISSITHELVGAPYPNDINAYKSMAQRKRIWNCWGEKSNCRKLSILKEYPFPVYDDCKFISENCVWEQINSKYDQYCTNDVFRVYYEDMPDSLNAGKVHSESKRRAQYHSFIIYLNQCRDMLIARKRLISSLVHMDRYAIQSNVSLKTVILDLKNNFLRILAALAYYPIKGAVILLKIR